MNEELIKVLNKINSTLGWIVVWLFLIWLAILVTGSIH
jgi:hypothetical protein